MRDSRSFAHLLACGRLTKCAQHGVLPASVRIPVLVHAQTWHRIHHRVPLESRPSVRESKRQEAHAGWLWKLSLSAAGCWPLAAAALFLEVGAWPAAGLTGSGTGTSTFGGKILDFCFAVTASSSPRLLAPQVFHANRFHTHGCHRSTPGQSTSGWKIRGVSSRIR